MSAEHKLQGRAETSGLGQIAWPFSAKLNTEMLRASYRGIFKMMLVANHHAATMAEINRKLVEENLTIFRKEQDALLDATEKMLGHFADSNGAPDPGIISKSMTELYGTAVAGLREFGQAMNDARSQSVEALRERARATAEVAAEIETELKTAA